MNIHHLELFYYVARHGGVSSAARHMPYGIQQPAISAQILQLEDNLGLTLFHRRPFKLTREGAALFAFVEPFVAGLPALAANLRGGEEKRLRIAAPDMVQREYLPTLFRRMAQRAPGFQFNLHAARMEQIEGALQEQAIDLGLATLLGKRPEGINSQPLAQLPLCLVVTAKSGIESAEDLWKRDRIDLPLITLAAAEPMCRLFSSEMEKRRLEWYPTLELSSLDLIDRYVQEGYGVGLTVAAPAAEPPPGIRHLPLQDFPTVTFSALWLGKLSPLAEMFLEEATALAKSLLGPPAAKRKGNADDRS